MNNNEMGIEYVLGLPALVYSQKNNPRKGYTVFDTPIGFLEYLDPKYGGNGDLAYLGESDVYRKIVEDPFYNYLYIGDFIVKDYVNKINVSEEERVKMLIVTVRFLMQALKGANDEQPRNE